MSNKEAIRKYIEAYETLDMGFLDILEPISKRLDKEFEEGIGTYMTYIARKIWKIFGDTLKQAEGVDEDE